MIYWVAPEGTSGIVNDKDTGGRSESSPWDLHFVRKKSNMGSLLQAGDIVYLIGNKGPYNLVNQAPNYVFDIECPTGGVNFSVEYEAGNYAGIKSGSINFMTAPGHPPAQIKRTGQRPPGSSYIISTGKAGYGLTAGRGIVFWNIEIYSTDWTRSRPDGGGNGSVSSGIALYGHNSGLINSITHNGAINIGPHKTGNGSFCYGILSSQSGWSEPDRKHGHNFYVQNSEANARRQSYINCIAQFSCGLNFQMYAESRDTVNGVETHLEANLDIFGCNFIDAGAITGTVPTTVKNLGDWNFLMGGYQKKINNRMLNCTSYNSTLNGTVDGQGGITGAGIKFGYVSQFNDQWIEDCQIEDNYLHNRSPITFTSLWRGNSFSNNTLIITNSTRLVNLTYRNGADIEVHNDFENNTWYAGNPNGYTSAFTESSFIFDQNLQQHVFTTTTHTVSSFKTKFNPLESTSSFISGVPATNKIFYRPNDFIGLDSVTTKGQNTGGIIIFNWGEFATVDVDLSELGFSSGDEYAIYDTQNFRGQAIHIGTYTGGDTAINMNQTQISATIGDLTDPIHTDNRHIHLLVYKTNDVGGSTNNPPVINNIPDRASIEKNSGQQTVNLSGISDPDGDTITITASTDRPDLIDDLTVNYTSPATTGTITYNPIAGQVGSGNITVIVNDGNISTIQIFTFNIQDNSVPDAAPSGLSSNNIGSTSFNASWVDNSSNETNFELEVYTTPGGSNPIDSSPIVINSNIITKQVTGLTPDTTYYFRVRATNAAGSSAYSSEASITTKEVNITAVDSLSLVNLSQFDDYEDSIALIDGNTYNLNEHIPNAFTIEAITDPLIIEGGSIVLEHVESGFTITESGYPYNMGYYDAVDPGNFPGFVLGTNTIRATPYDGPGGTGVASPTYEISFTIENKPAFLVEVENITIPKNTDIVELEFVTIKAPLDQGLTVTVESSNSSLFPISNITLGGNERDRTISLVPVFNKIGKSTITLTLSDGITQVTNTFDITVIEDDPVIGENFKTSVGVVILLA